MSAEKQRDELARIALLRAHFGASPLASFVRAGIGDDAAVLDLGAAQLVWTIDAQVDGTHFRSPWASWEDVGWRSFMAAASDLAAMGATPVAALSALALAPAVDDEALEAIARGQALAAKEVGAPIVGGNLARAEQTSVTTTLLGRASAPVLRSGAKPGDHVLLAGLLGFAAAGLQALSKNMQDAHFAACCSAWRRPHARISDGLALVGVASAAIDVSDGLARDVAHVAEASGVRAVLDEAALRAHVADLDLAAAALGRDTLDFALYGGEDYALVATSRTPIAGFVSIGLVEEGSGVWLRDAMGKVEALAARGFDHFAQDATK